MARPTKTGLEYFSLDTKMDDEVELIKAKFGTPGYGALIIMFQTIYDNGYYYSWTEREQLLFSMKVSDIGNLATSIIDEAIKWGIFNQKIFDKHKILTSKRIQNTYVSAVYKRVGIQMIKEYLLVDIKEKDYIQVISLNDNNNEETSVVSDIGNSDTSIVSDGKSTQSKVKESKVKETKVKEIKEDNIIILSPEENDFVSVLKGIKDYPLDREKDKELFNKLSEDFPTVDLIECAKDYATWLVDKPLKKTSNPRSQLRNFCKNAIKYNKNLKKGVKKSEGTNGSGSEYNFGF